MYYRDGFGVYNGDFWMGLERIYQLTSYGNYRLRIEVQATGWWVSDEYDSVYLDSEANASFI